MNRKLSYLLLFVFIIGCGRNFYKSPVDQLIVQMDSEPTFSILLYDMDVEGSFFKTYKHRYKIITTGVDGPEVAVTDWIEVDENYFWKNEENLGMELVSKNEDGVINKVPSPPGYGNYVGNEKYGQWVHRDGGSFWEFYGKWAMLNTVFNLMSPVNYRGYMDYRDNYRGYRPYYGSRDRSGRYSYGTRSNHSRQANPNFFERRQQKSGWKSSTPQRTTRPTGTARSYGSGSSRSRSGSFGK